MQDLRGIIVQGIREAVPRGQNINKAFNERQKKEETPTDWLERLRKNLQMYSGLDPETPLEQALLKTQFVAKSWEDIRKKLEKLDNWQDRDLDELLKEAQKGARIGRLLAAWSPRLTEESGPGNSTICWSAQEFEVFFAVLLDFGKIKQLPSEPFVTFVERLTRAIELQVKEEGAQEQVLEEMALTNANEQCKAAILSLPMEPAPTLDDMLHAVATEEHPTQKLNWKTDSPVWVEQWPLSKEKLKVLQELVDEQLAKGHIVETTSLWNSPVFVTKKANKGKWRLLHDRCQINNVIEDVGSLQPGMPSPAMLPQNWNLAIIDIKDCFFQIPLHPDNAPCFAFLVPTLNREALRKRYHWKFLPQGMKNSPSICQWYLSSLLSPVRAAVGEAIILHCMDDVLVCVPPMVTYCPTRLT
ncbi:hypothetical protein DUI87_01154 [Hirundo rustica rustica]|uniref:ribonuclease H n=1 Tax=Hirundo rustica rustica TaxID=333673 RepID=A0A3M0LMJ6_HIRRU|nr:hypothetical protein DUI87_01154 [Hirundo rustica rustica]